jgi:chromosomal replication initiation ATPase DnaA
MSMELEEQLIERYKSDFTTRTGKSIVILSSGRWESRANFTTDKVEFWKVVKMVFEYTGWTRGETYNQSRVPERVFRRALIDYIAVNNGSSLVTCSRLTGRKDHTTVIHSISTFETKLEVDAWVRKFFNEVMGFIRDNYHLYKVKTITEEDIP